MKTKVLRKIVGKNADQFKVIGKLFKASESVGSEMSELDTNDDILEYLNDEMDIYNIEDLSEHLGEDVVGNGYSNDSMGLLDWVSDNVDNLEKLFNEE